MKWTSKLTDDELREMYELLLHNEGKIVDIHISKGDCETFLEGHICIPEEYENDVRIIDRVYILTDFYVRTGYLNDNNKDLSEIFREYMYKKFGDEYAKDYLFNYYDLSDVRLLNRD